MNNFLYIMFDWCAKAEVQDIFRILKTILDILKIVVPIGLIVMTSIDIAKKVLNPDEKEGQKKIMIRAIAAVIVFFTPTIIQFFCQLIDTAAGRGSSYQDSRSGLSQCLKGW